MTYIVKIEERLVRTVGIEAKDEKEALAKADRMYREARIVLDTEDFEGEPHITCYGPTYSRPDLARQITKEYD